MNWIHLKNEQQIDDIKSKRFEQFIVIFNHNTRCSIFIMVKNRLERENPTEKILFCYLDLLKFRSLSNSLSTTFSVHHESPQIILIQNGAYNYDESHKSIIMDETIKQNTKFYYQ